VASAHFGSSATMKTRRLKNTDGIKITLLSQKAHEEKIQGFTNSRMAEEHMIQHITEHGYAHLEQSKSARLSMITNGQIGLQLHGIGILRSTIILIILRHHRHQHGASL